LEHILTKTEVASDLFDLQEVEFNRRERIILAVFVLFVGAIGLIGGWSFVLLLTGKTAGGGPLGLVASLLHF